jgi:hypothetical protein
VSDPDTVNPEHNQGHVSPERINDAHTRMTREQIGFRHGAYHQGEEGCYICSLLIENQGLTEERDALRAERERARQTHAEERKLAEGHLTELSMDTPKDEGLRLELLRLYRTFADATDAALSQDTESPGDPPEPLPGATYTPGDTESPEPTLDKQVRLAAEERANLPEYLRGKGLSVKTESPEEPA